MAEAGLAKTLLALDKELGWGDTERGEANPLYRHVSTGPSGPSVWGERLGREDEERGEPGPRENCSAERCLRQ